MTRPGPAPQPIELRRVLGNPGHRPLPEEAKSAEIGELLDWADPPDDLLPEGQELWREVVPVLARFGALREIDLPAIKSMCLAWARAERLARVLDKQGYFTAGSTGQMVAHPALKAESDARSAFLRYASEFGLTWIARSRLGLNEATRQSILAGMGDKLGANPRARD